MPRFAIKTAPQHTTWEAMLDVWRAADEQEVFESAWNFDHLYPIHGDPHGPCLEAWVTLSALAQATARLRVGCMVHGMHFRHPAITAKMAASLDIVSGGRLILGLGAGWYETEVDAYGLDLGSVRERMDRFDEGVEVVSRLLTDEVTNFDGRHYRLRDARCEPKGPQRPRPPIMIGGGGEKRTLRTVARWANMWDGMRADVEQFRHKLDVLGAHCEEIGRDPSEITTTCHFIWKSDDDIGPHLERAESLFGSGLDVAIFALVPPFDHSSVEKLSRELETFV